MLKLSHIALCSVFLLALGAGCSNNNPTGTTGGGTGCSPACGANATCNLDTLTCACYPGYSNCPGAADGGGDGDGGAGTVCAQVQLDNNNCGGCGIVCPNGESCLGGSCTCHLTVCPSGDGGGMVCTDPENDPLNCGMCGKVCPTGENCVLGECACVPSLTIAQCASDGGLECADLTKDDDNCGGCGIMCAANQHCAAPGGAGGVCVCDVDAGPGEPLLPIENCGGTCQDTTSDPFNCGGCGNVCVSGSCIEGDAGVGVCNCPPPYSQCGPDCVDTYSDINHCGNCDYDCTIVGPGLTELNCNLGRCYCGPTGQGTICSDGTCANLGRDADNCGTCGNVCLAPATDCVNGTCTCPDSESLCGSPDAGIPLFCINTTDDAQNCGACANVCADSYAGPGTPGKDQAAGCRFGLCTCSPGQSQLCAASSPGGGLPVCTCQLDTVNNGACNTLSFAADIYPLLAQQSGTFGCSASGCHSGPNPAAGLAFLDSNYHMDAGMAFAELLLPPPGGSSPDAGIPYCDAGVPADAPSSQCRCVSRVLPGSHGSSYLIDVLLNAPCDGKLAMPIDDAGSWTPLGTCSQQLMQQWIDTGAAP